MRLTIHFILLVLSLTLINSTKAWTQGSTSSRITGQISSNNEALIGATIMALHTPTGFEYGTTSNVEGYFSLNNVNVGGPYQITISFLGYQDEVINDIYLGLGQTETFNINLSESSTTLDEIVITTGGLFDGNRTGSETKVSEQAISTLPSAALSFWVWSNASFNANSAQNTLLVEASDGAGGWDTVTVINQDALDWQFKLYDLSSYTYGPNNNLVQIRFDGIPQSSTGTIFYNDIALDDIKIDAMPTSVCAPIMAPDTMGFEDGGVMKYTN